MGGPRGLIRLIVAGQVSIATLDMLSRLSNRIDSWAKGWLVLATIAAFAQVANLPLVDPALISTSLDGRIAYTAEEAFSTIEAYSDAEREQMIWIHVWDLALIALYTSMLCLATARLFQRGFAHDSGARGLNLIPLLRGGLDVMENVWIVTMIIVYPARPGVLGWLASLFTTGKYLMGVPIVLLLLIGLVRAAMHGFRPYQTDQEADV